MALLFLTGNYQVIGRVVHMNYLQEYFAAKKSMKFGNIQRKPNRLQLEILADTVYIEVCIQKSMNVTTEELSSKNPLLLATCELALGIVTSPYLIYHPHVSL